jgi:hypothetical protein
MGFAWVVFVVIQFIPEPVLSEPSCRRTESAFRLRRPQWESPPFWPGGGGREGVTLPFPWNMAINYR